MVSILIFLNFLGRKIKEKNNSSMAVGSLRHKVRTNCTLTNEDWSVRQNAKWRGFSKISINSLAF